MRPSLTFATPAISAAVLCSVVVGPAGSAGAITNAASTISGLQQEGYTVHVDRVGAGSIDECVVTSVRNPHTNTRYIKDYYGKKDKNGKRKYRLIEIVVSRTIQVSLNCTTRT